MNTKIITWLKLLLGYWELQKASISQPVTEANELASYDTAVMLVVCDL